MYPDMETKTYQKSTEQIQNGAHDLQFGRRRSYRKSVVRVMSGSTSSSLVQVDGTNIEAAYERR